MTLNFVPAFSLPGDDAVIHETLRRAGRVEAITPLEMPHFVRAVAGLAVMELVGHAGGAAVPDGILLYEIWLGVHGNEAQSCGAWFNLGVLHMQAGKPVAAAEAYRAALRLRPDLAEAAINLGTALEASGEVDAALAAWRGALPLPPLRQVLHNQLGRVLESQGRLGPAAAELRASLLISPDQPDVQQHLVHLRQRMAAWPAARLDVPGISADEAGRNCGRWRRWRCLTTRHNRPRSPQTGSPGRFPPPANGWRPPQAIAMTGSGWAIFQPISAAMP